MTDIYAPAREVTRNFRYATEITDLVTAEGILLAMDCPATAANVRKVIGKLEALSLDHIALTQHWA